VSLTRAARREEFGPGFQLRDHSRLVTLNCAGKFAAPINSKTRPKVSCGPDAQTSHLQTAINPSP
jgi:hypothetical protein